ncbi:MAG: hypothetical protein J0L92_28725 [Deltaproteobacteria bacterium]|nr:hypothetical protein [Deltaproteobacteria bacterium]
MYVNVEEDPTAVVRWMPALLRGQGHLIRLVLDELVPVLSPDDPTYDERMGGIRRMGHGTSEMVLGLCEMLSDPRVPAPLRRELVAALCDHASTIARIWLPEERSQALSALRIAREAEQDPEVAAALDEVRAAIASNH